jgi:hypothetical protein
MLNSRYSKVLKMDYKGQTTVLAATSFVLVGMMFLVPAITEKALGAIHATAYGTCGGYPTLSGTAPKYSCQLTLVGKSLDDGRWISEPTQSGAVVTWSTAGKPPFGDEKGDVTYDIGMLHQRVTLSFDNPVVGSNKCNVSGDVSATCTAGKGQSAEFTYHVRGRA